MIWVVAFGGDVDFFLVQVGGDHIDRALDGAGVFAHDFDGVAPHFRGFVGVAEQIGNGVLSCSQIIW